MWSYTSWSLLVVSLRTPRLIFRPNLRTELALRTSSSLVLLIGIVPSGHGSPAPVQACITSETDTFESCPLGLFGGSCIYQNQELKFLLISSTYLNFFFFLFFFLPMASGLWGEGDQKLVEDELGHNQSYLLQGSKQHSNRKKKFKKTEQPKIKQCSIIKFQEKNTSMVLTAGLLIFLR